MGSCICSEPFLLYSDSHTWILGLQAKRNVVALYIGLGFGLFGISHIAVLLGSQSSEISLLVVRTLGYLVVIFAMYKAAFQR